MPQFKKLSNHKQNCVKKLDMKCNTMQNQMSPPHKHARMKLRSSSIPSEECLSRPKYTIPTKIPNHNYTITKKFCSKTNTNQDCQKVHDAKSNSLNHFDNMEHKNKNISVDKVKGLDEKNNGKDKFMDVDYDMNHYLKQTSKQKILWTPKSAWRRPSSSGHSAGINTPSSSSTCSSGPSLQSLSNQKTISLRSGNIIANNYCAMINAKQNGRISPTLSTISNFSYSSNVSGLSYSSSTETPKVPRLVPLERVFIGPNGKRHKSFKTSSESSFKPLSSADLSPTHERSKNNFPTKPKTPTNKNRQDFNHNFSNHPIKKTRVDKSGNFIATNANSIKSDNFSSNSVSSMSDSSKDYKNKIAKNKGSYSEPQKMKRKRPGLKLNKMIKKTREANLRDDSERGDDEKSENNLMIDGKVEKCKYQSLPLSPSDSPTNEPDEFKKPQGTKGRASPYAASISSNDCKLTDPLSNYTNNWHLSLHCKLAADKILPSPCRTSCVSENGSYSSSGNLNPNFRKITFNDEPSDPHRARYNLRSRIVIVPEKTDTTNEMIDDEKLIKKPEFDNNENNQDNFRANYSLYNERISPCFTLDRYLGNPMGSSFDNKAFDEQLELAQDEHHQNVENQYSQYYHTVVQKHYQQNTNQSKNSKQDLSPCFLNNLPDYQMVTRSQAAFYNSLNDSSASSASETEEEEMPRLGEIDIEQLENDV